MTHRDDCSLPECSRVYYARDLCRLHYDRARASGDPLVTKFATPEMSLLDRLCRHFQEGEGCWEWTGTTNKDGYGYTTYQNRYTLAHRAMFEIHHRPLSDGEVVRHDCDNPPCVNPRHMQAGTNGDNQRDKAERLRSTYGEKNPSVVLTEDAVRDLRRDRALGATYADLSSKYGISNTQVGRIVRGESWSYAGLHS